MELKENLKYMLYEILIENTIDIISNNLAKLDNGKIEGRFLNKQQAKELQDEIESNYVIDPKDLFNNNNDIRSNLFNFDNPLAEKIINGVKLKIVEGLIRDNRKTYLLYANENIIGEFYSVKDIKNIVNYIESKLTKNLSK